MIQVIDTSYPFYRVGRRYFTRLSDARKQGKITGEQVERFLQPAERGQDQDKCFRPLAGKVNTMTTIFVYNNEDGRQVARYTASDNAECEVWAEENYGSNDFHWSYAETPLSNAVAGKVVSK